MPRRDDGGFERKVLEDILSEVNNYETWENPPGSTTKNNYNYIAKYDGVIFYIITYAIPSQEFAKASLTISSGGMFKERNSSNSDWDMCQLQQNLHLIMHPKVPMLYALVPGLK